MSIRRLLCPVLSVLVALVAACGDNAVPVDRLQSLAVTPTQATLAIGGSVALTATGTYDAGPRNVTADAAWTSSAPAIATVVGGRVTAVAAGEATITASLDDQSATVRIRVTAVALTEIAITPPTSAVAAGIRTTLIATGMFADGTTADVTAQATWTAAPPAIATVVSPGVVEGEAPGTATVTATVGTVAGTAEVTVTDAVLTRLELAPVTASIPAGTTQQYVATGHFSDDSNLPVTGQATWSSSRTEVATVSATGLATAVAPGTTTITATFGRETATVELTVTSAVLTSIQVTADDLEIADGTTSQFTATGRFSDGTTRNLTAEATWSSTATAIATVSDDAATKGLATGVAPGVARIRAAFSGITGEAELRVTDAFLVSIAVEPPTPSLARGTTLQLTAVGSFSDSSTQVLTTQVTWRSSDTAVATISNATGSEGRVDGATVGTSTISATLGTIEGSTQLTVTSAVLQRLAVTPSASSVAAGRTVPLIATAIFTDGSTQVFTDNVTWTSSADPIASVSNADGSRGVVTARSVGEATITAASGTITATARVDVTAAVIRDIEVTPTAAVIANGTAQQFTATAIFSNDTTLDVTGDVTWESSRTTVATISNADDSAGLATSVAGGQTVISAALEGITGSTTLTVDVLTSLVVEPATLTVPAGTDGELAAFAVLSNGARQELTDQVTWSSSADTVARVSNADGSEGVVTGLIVGTATITAEFRGATGTAAVTVSPAVLRSIAITPADATLPLGDTRPLVATGRFSDGSTSEITTQVTWDSSAPTTIEVSNADGSRGAVHARALGGPVTITATLGSITGSLALTVSPAVLRSIAITPADGSTPIGLLTPLTATATYSDATTENVTARATWSSSDETVATVSNANPRGRATPLATGVTTIRAVADGVAGTTTLRVTEPVVVSVAPFPATRSIVDGATARYTAIATLDNNLTRDVTADATFTVAAPTVAVVSAVDGFRNHVTALAAGEAQVTATFQTFSGTATLTVTADQACTVTTEAGTVANTVLGPDARCYAGITPAVPGTWAAARAACQALGGDLVVLDSARANELARLALPAAQSGWIGYTDAVAEAGTVAAAFVDVTGAAIGTRFHAFGASEPDDAGGAEDCVAFSKTGGPAAADRWLDLSCDTPATVVESFVCETTQAKLVIGEIDYDQPTPPSADSASFVEVRNAGSAPASLAGIRLVYVNGAASQRRQYGEPVDLTSFATLAPGEVLVVGNATITDALPATVKKVTVNGDFLQNGGAPDGDGIVLLDGCTVVDKLTYEGTVVTSTITGCTGTFDLLEGSGVGDAVEDRVSPGVQGSLVRNGPDTDNTVSDWSFQSPPTPGL